MVDTLHQKFISILTLYTFSQQYSKIIFLLPNNGIEWSLDFGPVSFTLTVKGIVQGMTMSSQEILLAAWSLL